MRRQYRRIVHVLVSLAGIPLAGLMMALASDLAHPGSAILGVLGVCLFILSVGSVVYWTNKLLR